MNLWIIFLTGLTTGGLTCLALQGGLLATAIAAQREVPDGTSLKNANKGISATFRPTLIFLLAKIAAYTVVGFLLGWLGTVFQLSITSQIIIQFAVGAIPLAFLGLLHPVIAEIAMASSSITVVMNANLLKKIKV